MPRCRLQWVVMVVSGSLNYRWSYDGHGATDWILDVTPAFYTHPPCVCVCFASASFCCIVNWRLPSPLDDGSICTYSAAAVTSPLLPACKLVSDWFTCSLVYVAAAATRVRWWCSLGFSTNRFICTIRKELDKRSLQTSNVMLLHPLISNFTFTNITYCKLRRKLEIHRNTKLAITNFVL